MSFKTNKGVGSTYSNLNNNLNQKEKQLNKRRQTILALSVLIILIASFFALFFQKNHSKAMSPSPINIGTEVVLIQPLPPELIRKAAYNAKLGELETKHNQEWFIEYKALLEEYSDVVDKPETIYDHYSSVELDLLFRVVQAEIGNGYSFDQKVNVCSVIFNRIKDGRFGGSLREVLNENQFSTISSGAIYRTTIEEKTILACEYAFIQGDTTGGALYFHSGQARSSFSGRSFKYSDGAHNFY